MDKEIGHIWNQFHRELKSFVISKVGNTVDADDILQNAFIKIAKNQDKVIGAHNTRQYLYAIIRNTTIDFLRKQKRQGNALEEKLQSDLTEEETDSLNAVIAECCIRPFINKLPDKYKEVLVLSEFSHIPQNELAERFNMSHSGMKSRVQRGRKKLKELILQCCSLKSDVYGNLQGNNDCIGPCD